MPEVKLPELAESITEGTIAEWLKNVGDSVEKGEAILELETDKVNVEVVSEEAGVLSEQLASEGDTEKLDKQLLSSAKVVAMLLKKIVTTILHNKMKKQIIKKKKQQIIR